jgi:ureidoglycolate amidohydrolase
MTQAAQQFALEIDEAALSADLSELARFTHVEQPDEGTAVTRVIFTEDDLRARAWLKAKAHAAGLSVCEDAVGNTFLRLEGTDPSLPPVATGSHTDAIPHAGMYDGTVGVLGGLEALRAIQRAGLQPKRSIEVVMLTSEEPTRFGIGCLGSRLMAGTLAPERADTLPDLLPGADGRTLQAVRSAAGFTGDLSTVRLKHGHYSAWLELHIEQGPLLEKRGVPLGVVTHIAAPASYRFTVYGLGGHAGALLMPDRRDALCAAAEIILCLERRALATAAIDTVATVGTCEVHPGAVNSVPSRVVLQVDLRDTDPERRESVIAGVRDEIASMAERRGVRVEETLINADPPAVCDPELVELLTGICARDGFACDRMVSRAYHDTLFMAQIAPVAMLFIPCRGGVSHRPDEFATAADIARGTRVLAEALAALASP